MDYSVGLLLCRRGLSLFIHIFGEGGRWFVRFGGDLFCVAVEIGSL